MKETIVELQKEKIRIRTSNPLRSEIIEMFVNIATKTAKSESRGVTSDDLDNAVKKCIKETEKAIVVIKTHEGNSEKWEKELAELKKFLI